MQVALEILLIASAITQNVVASWMPAWLLPWGLPLLVGLVALYLPLRFKLAATGAQAWAPLTPRAKAGWVLRAAAVGLAAFIASWLGERFYYGTVQLDGPEIQAYPGEVLEVTGRNFALVNPKINTARIAVNGTITGLPIAEVAEGNPQRLKMAMPDPLPAGEATLIVDGPLSFIIPNRATARLKIPSSPNVTAVEPSIAYRKSDIKLHGENIDTRSDPAQQRFKTSVQIGGAPATIARVDRCKPGPWCLTVRVPEHAAIGPAEIVVTTAVGNGTGQMRILGAPHIDDVSPLAVFPHKDGYVDSIITVTGAEFDPGKDNKDMRVYIGDTKPPAEAKVLREGRTDTQFKLAIPAVAKGGPVIIVTPDGTATSAKDIELLPPPQVDHIDPAQAEPGAIITITGAHFDQTTPSNNRARFGDLVVKATKAYEADGSERIEVRVPADVRDGNIVVETPSGARETQLFRVIPRITSFSPAEGTIGSQVTIYGKGFFDRTLQVRFGDQTVSPISVVPNAGGEDTIVFKVPAGSPDRAIVGVRLGPQREANSPGMFQISRLEELQGVRMPREASYEDGTISETLRVDCQTGNDVEIVRTKPERKTFKVSAGQCPIDIAVDQPNYHAYVANAVSNTITSIDLSSNKQDGTFDTGGAQPVRIVLVEGKLPYWVTNDRRLMWPNAQKPSGPPEEQPIDGEFRGIYVGSERGAMMITQRADGTVIATPVGPRWDKSCVGKGTEISSGGKAVSAASRRRIYVANFGSDTLTKIEFTCKPLPETIKLDVGARPVAFAVNPDPGHPELWVAEYGLNRISTIDTNDDTRKGKAIDVGPHPRLLAFHPKGCFAYVITEDDRALTRIRTADRQIDGESMTPKQPGKVLDLAFSSDTITIVLDNGRATSVQSCKRAGAK